MAWPPLTHASVRTAAGRQAHAPTPGRRFFVDAMQFPSRRSSIVNANQVHRRRLHAERQLVIRQMNDLRRGILQMRAGAESFRELARLQKPQPLVIPSCSQSSRPLPVL